MVSITAGIVTPSQKVWVITDAHDHKKLKEGDRVIMTETPSFQNLLYRPSDDTLHDLSDDHEQYVHMEEATKS
jgi:hypothetical protein